MTPLKEWYYELPIVTRSYITLVFIETLACQLDLIRPFQLHFSYDLVFKGHQYWRLLTSFLYFGGLSVDFIFMFFLVQYSRTLEDGYFRGRTLDFAWMLLLSMAAIVTLTPILWSWPTGDLVGLMVGRTYFFFDDVWPSGGGTVVGGVREERPKILRGRGGAEVVALDGGFDVGAAAAIPREMNEANENQPQEIPGATGQYEVWNPNGNNHDDNQLRQRNTRGNDANDEEMILKALIEKREQ
ncbi:UNVERIFIED_CONTAM: Derlin-2 [Siphonaria sp. JEL0065]|nr:Derlin-2 [Siphonaria sp. JEL0065]